jgi:hypothetical protein
LTRQKCRLGRTNNFLGYLGDSICDHFGKYFEAYIKQTYWFVLLYLCCFPTLR